MHWGFKKILCKACLLNRFLVIKRILKALFSFIPWLNFSDLSSYASNLKKRYTLRLLSKCIGRNTSISGVKSPPPPFNPSSILLDGLQLYLCSKLLENGAKFIQKLTPGFKNHTRNLDNLCLDNLWNMDKQWKVHEVEIQWATLSKKYIPSS